MLPNRPRPLKMRFPGVRLLNLALWRDVVYHALKYRLLSLTAGIAYPALLGLLLGSVAVLLAAGLMQPGWRSGLGSPLSQVLPMTPLTEFATWAEGIAINQRRRWLVVAGCLAWWAGAVALQGLLRTFDIIHQIPLNQRRLPLRSRLLALALTPTLGIAVGLTLSLAYAGSGTVQGALASGSSFALWAAALKRLMYWLLALGVMTAALIALYRLGPSRFLAGTPLFPGAVVTALTWVGALALWQRAAAPLQAYQANFGTVGLLVLVMVWVYCGLLMVLTGDQVNVSVARQRAMRPPFQMRRDVMPPSFDSFTIRRRDDRFP